MTMAIIKKNVYVKTQSFRSKASDKLILQAISDLGGMVSWKIVSVLTKF